MKETLALLIVAHILADFLFQTAWMAEAKQKRRSILLLHIAIVAVTTGLILGQWQSQLLWIVVVSHLAIDYLKTFLGSRLWSFLLDQTLHLGVIVGGSALYPDTAKNGWWFRLADQPTEDLLMKAFVVIGGIVLCLNAGGIIIAQVLKPMLTKEELQKLEGIPNGGKLIGLLERSLVMLFMWINQPAGIGFLVTAKSILRFGDIRDGHQRKLTEYVIIGTFLSFGWALLVTSLLQRTLTLW